VTWSPFPVCIVLTCKVFHLYCNHVQLGQRFDDYNYSTAASTFLLFLSRNTPTTLVVIHGKPRRDCYAAVAMNDLLVMGHCVW
jgi:hypothetical protein